MTKIRAMVILGIFLGVFLATGVFASSTIETLYVGGSFFFEGHNVFISISSNYETLMIRVDNTPYFVSTGLTRQEFDFESSKADREIILSSPRRISHGDLNVYLERICFDISKNNCGR
ncbi:MAG: hypothetical protein ACMXYK_02835, partial [Candidatus Woesearchaeota archaeon]